MSGFLSDASGQSSRLLHSRAARLVVMGSVMILWQLLGRLSLLDPEPPGTTARSGPLTPYRLAADQEPARCREASCTVTALPLRAAGPAVWMPARFALPAPQWIEAPPGHVFVVHDPNAPLPLTLRGPTAGTRALAMSTMPASAQEAPSRLADTLDVPGPGGVIAARLVDLPGWQMRGDGQLVDAQNRVMSAPPRPLLSAVLFQPVPVEWTLELSTDQVPLPSPDTPLRVLMREPEPRPAGSAAPVASESPPHIDGRLHRVEGRRLTIVFDPYRIDDFVRQRLLDHATNATPLWTDQPVIEWNNPTLATRRVRVPQASLVRDADPPRVWVEVKDYAVPVTVRPLASAGDWPVITEVPGAMGLPIRAEDWKAMPAAARAAVYREISQPDPAAAAPLLVPTRRLIDPTRQALQPGQRVRFEP